MAMRRGVASGRVNVRIAEPLGHEERPQMVHAMGSGGGGRSRRIRQKARKRGCKAEGEFGLRERVGRLEMELRAQSG